MYYFKAKGSSPKYFIKYIGFFKKLKGWQNNDGKSKTDSKGI